MKNYTDIPEFKCKKNSRSRRQKCAQSTISLQYPVYSCNSDQYYEIPIIKDICISSYNDQTYFKVTSNSCNNALLSIYNTSDGDCNDNNLLDKTSLLTINIDGTDQNCVYIKGCSSNNDPHTKSTTLSRILWFTLLYILTVAICSLMCITTAKIKPLWRTYKRLAMVTSDEKTGEFTWKLTRRELAIFIQCLCGTELTIMPMMTSDLYETFEMHGIKWMISVQDCYNYQQHAILDLLCNDDNLKNLRVIVTFEIVELQIKCTTMKDFTADNKQLGCTLNFQQTVKAWESELIQRYKNNKQVTIKCTLKLFAFSCPNSLTAGQNFNVKCKFDKVMMDKFKTVNKYYCYESELFFDLFLLRFYPNYTDDGYSCVEITNIAYKSGQNLQLYGCLTCDGKGHLYQFIGDICNNDCGHFSKYIFQDKITDFGDEMTLNLNTQIIDYYDGKNFIHSLEMLHDPTPKQKCVLSQYFQDLYYNTDYIFPQDIIRLIAKFYPKLNGNTINWNFHESFSTLNMFLSWNFAEKDRYLQSNIINTMNLHWKFLICPNGGNDVDNIMIPNLFLCYFPQYLSSIILNYRVIVQCDDIFITFTNIFELNKQDRLGGRWAPHGFDILRRLKSMDTSVFRIGYFINILDVIDDDGLSVYRFNDSLGLNGRSYYGLEWNIKQKYQIEAIGNGGRPSIYFESEIFCNLWCMRLDIDNGVYNLWLQLCSLPMDVDGLNVDVTVVWFTEKSNGKLCKMDCNFNYDESNVVFMLPAYSDFIKFKTLINVNM